MNAMNTLVPSRTSRPDGPSGERAGDATGNATGDVTGHGPDAVRPEAARPRAALAARVRDADGMAVASFVMGLAGLLVFNLVLGPCALVLAGLALKRGTTRRTRAVLGLTLGAADLAVLAAVGAADQSFSWSITG